MQTVRQKIGNKGEDLAEDFLLKNGYEIIARNVRFRDGEIDIVAKCVKPHFGSTLCFVEVKTRSGESGSAERATGYEKIRHLARAARRYCLLKKINLNQTPIQFEQVSVYLNGDNSPFCRLLTIPPEGFWRDF